MAPDSFYKQARLELNLNEVDTILSTVNVIPTQNNPLATFVGTDIIVYPTGQDYTLFYLFRFPRITDNDVEINKLGGPNQVFIPVLFQEIIIQKAQIYVHERALTMENISVEDRKQQTDLIQTIQKKLDNDLKPMTQANKKANTA